MSEYRSEKDSLGELEIPAEALWGIHTQRAMENFPLSGLPVRRSLAHAYGAVKLAAAQTNHALGYLTEEKFTVTEKACSELMNGLLDEHIVVDRYQGGAGTSLNMNINEAIANRALQLLGEKPGAYDRIHPIDDVNLHQSTNDTYPTALKVAAIFGIRELEQNVVGLTEAFQRKESQFAGIVKVGRTQMQDAVLTTLGREMSAFADAFARDRWRLYKCEERLRVVNLGGTAIGTGITAPRQYIFAVVEKLKNITGIGLARAENLVEATQNNDVFVEVSGILKACATNLYKIANDLRFMASGPGAGIAELSLPQRQAGSSIMPGKVNPVIPEAAMQAAMQVMANDATIAMAVANGNLELNAFMPLIAEALLGSIELLTNAVDIFCRFAVEGMEADEDACRKGVDTSTAVATALVEVIGYEQAAGIAQEALKTGKTIREIVLLKGIMSLADFEQLTSPENVNKLGSKK